MNQFSSWHQVVSFIVCCLVSFAIAESNNCSIHRVLVDNIVDSAKIKELVPQSIVLGDVSFESDVILQKEEFAHLFGHNRGDSIDHQALVAVFERCSKKNKFSEIQLRVETDNDAVQLHFIFQAAWTFKKIKIHNVYQGKHVLAQCYLMERGDLFDEVKHEHSLSKIKEYLLHNGYFESTIKSHYEYDYQTKEIIVHLSIKKGRRFYCDAIDVEIDCANCSTDDHEAISKMVKKKLSYALSSRVYTKEQLEKENNALQDYLAKKGYFHSVVEYNETVDYAQAVVNVLWKITMYQKREIVFFGHRFFSKKQLLEKILAFGQSVWLLPASLLAQEIVQSYKNKGFLHVDVITQEEKGRSFFIIKEGVRAIIKDVEIKNGPYADQHNFKKQSFGKLLKHSYFDVQLYDDAVAQLTQLYGEHGYAACIVVQYDFVPTEKENEFVLMVTVDEGTQKCVTSIIVDGCPQAQQADCFKVPSNGSPLVFSSVLIDEQRMWLVHHFQSLGFMHPHCKSAIELHDGNIAIKWSVDPGKKVRFGKTVVAGSSTFPFAYLERLLCYHEGDVWDQAKIKQTFCSLKELEIFESIYFSSDAIDHDDKKAVLVKLQLDDRYEVRTRAGFELQHVRKYQTFSGLTYKLGGTALIKNPTNCADQLRFDCDFARSHREIVGRYRRPWFTRNPFFTLFQVYSVVYDQPGFIGSTNDIYTLIQHGFFFGLQKKNAYCDIAWNNGCEWMKLHIKDNEEQLSFAKAIDFKPQLLDKTVPFFFTEPTIMIERLDNVLQPTSGGVGLLSFKGMIPLQAKYKDSLFFKLLCEQSFFVPIKMVVAAVRFRCGHIFYREFAGIMPSERFYLGGSHSLRGYEADLAPPLGVFKDDDGEHHVVPRGGRTMINGNIELRFPLYKKIGAVVFQDFGALSGTLFADFKPQDLLAATGFGFRIFTPLGPLRFDIGWKWHKQMPIERSFAWFLTFGQAF
jgi:outer membrane protein insertion porin family